MSNAITSASPSPLSGTPALPWIHAFGDLYRITVDEYERLADAGVLQDRRVELINGWLVRKMTTKPPHVVAVHAARELIAGVLPKGWWLREEKPVRIPDFDEPEPDLSVVRRVADGLSHAASGSGELELLIEVSDSSLSWDRGEKSLAYALRLQCRHTGFSTSSNGSSRFTPIQSPPATRSVRSLDLSVRPA